MAHYFPKLVDLHNYAAANAVDQKTYNWDTLNEKVTAIEHDGTLSQQQQMDLGGVIGWNGVNEEDRAEHSSHPWASSGIRTSLLRLEEHQP